MSSYNIILFHRVIFGPTHGFRMNAVLQYSHSIFFMPLQGHFLLNYPQAYLHGKALRVFQVKEIGKSHFPISEAQASERCQKWEENMIR